MNSRWGMPSLDLLLSRLFMIHMSQCYVGYVITVHFSFPYSMLLLHCSLGVLSTALLIEWTE